MLGKLFKYEFRATARVFLPMYAVILVMSVVARLFYTGNFNSETPAVLITILMVMLFTALWVVTLVIIIRRFWTNILGREGYLMNVLPVHPWEHVFSKMITSTVWCVASIIFSVLPLMIMLFGLQLTSVHFGEVFRWIGRIWEDVSNAGLASQAVLFIVQFIVTVILSVFDFILAAYAAMCVGQLVNKHRIWASIGAYFGISIIESIITSILGVQQLTGISSNDFEQTADAAMYAMMLANKHMFLALVITLVFCAAMFFSSTTILRRRLNLQ